MEKSTTRSFWFVIIFLSGGTFALWANFFHSNSLVIDNSKAIALGTKQGFPSVPVVTPPKNVSNIQKSNPVVTPKSVQQTQNITVTTPVSTRTTKTS